MKVKKGSTIELFIEFTDNEWLVVGTSPEVKSRAKTGHIEYPLTISILEDKKIVALVADTSDWAIGKYRADVYITFNGKRIYIPNEDYIVFELISPITTPDI